MLWLTSFSNKAEGVATALVENVISVKQVLESMQKKLTYAALEINILNLELAKQEEVHFVEVK